MSDQLHSEIWLHVIVMINNAHGATVFSPPARIFKPEPTVGVAT